MSNASTPAEGGLPRLFTLYEVAEATRRRYETVLAHVKDGRLHTVRPGGIGRHLVTEDEFARYVHGEEVSR